MVLVGDMLLMILITYIDSNTCRNIAFITVNNLFTAPIQGQSTWFKHIIELVQTNSPASQTCVFTRAYEHHMRRLSSHVVGLAIPCLPAMRHHDTALSQALPSAFAAGRGGWVVSLVDIEDNHGHQAIPCSTPPPIELS